MGSVGSSNHAQNVVWLARCLDVDLSFADSRRRSRSHDDKLCIKVFARGCSGNDGRSVRCWAERNTVHRWCVLRSMSFLRLGGERPGILRWQRTARLDADGEIAVAKNSLKEVIRSIQDNEDADQAYARLFGHQMRPCTFRRVFAVLQGGEETTEVDAETATKIKGYISEKLNVDEAFQSHCPDFVSPGEFSVAFEKEKKARKQQASQSAAAQEKPVASKKSVQPTDNQPA